jgi:hypothetical protein
MDIQLKSACYVITAGDSPSPFGGMAAARTSQRNGSAVKASFLDWSIICSAKSRGIGTNNHSGYRGPPECANDFVIRHRVIASAKRVPDDGNVIGANQQVVDRTIRWKSGEFACLGLREIEAGDSDESKIRIFLVYVDPPLHINLPSVLGGKSRAVDINYEMPPAILARQTVSVEIDVPRISRSIRRIGKLGIINPRSRTLSANCFPIGTSGHDAPAPSTKHDRGCSIALSIGFNLLIRRGMRSFYPA